MANPNAPAPKPPTKMLTAHGYVIAVLRARENQRPRELKLLEKVDPAERDKARELLAKLGG